jgi:tetratricopeptide (TPR) repeat protein
MNDSDLTRELQLLVAVQLLDEQTVEQFMFHHALTHEAAYASLLRSDRKQLHLLVAETVERVYAHTLDTYLGDLAHHFRLAGADTQAMRYAWRAGEQAQAMYAPREAIKYFTQAAEATSRLAQPTPPALYRARGRAYELIDDFASALHDYERALEMAWELRDMQAEWQALIDLGFLWAARDYERMGDYLQHALVVARKLGDAAKLASTLNYIGNWHINIEQPLKGLSYHHEALRAFETLQDMTGLADTRDLLGAAYWLNGDFVQSMTNCDLAIPSFRALDKREHLASSLAMRANMGTNFYNDSTVTVARAFSEVLHDGEEAITLAQAIGKRAAEAFARAVMVGNLWEQGEYTQAFVMGQMALDIARDIQHRQWMGIALGFLGALYHHVLQLDEAQRYLTQSVQLAREVGSLFHTRNLTALLATTYVRQQQFAQAQAVLADVLDTSSDISNQLTLAERQCWAAYAELLLAQGESRRALQVVEQLMVTAVNLTAEKVIPRLWLLRGMALMELELFTEAETALRAVCAATHTQGRRPLLWRVHLALGQLYLAQAQHDQAAHEFARTRELITELAARTPESLRESFAQRAMALIPMMMSTPLR